MNLTSSTQSGFTTFWFLAALVFVATFVTVITLQYQATQTGDLAVVPTGTETPAQALEIPPPDRADKQPVGQEGKPDAGAGNETMLAGSLAGEEASLPAAAHPAQIATDTRHAEWVEKLYVQLNSLEPPAAGMEDTAPVISGRVLTRSGRPVSGIEVNAQFRDYFKTGASDARTTTTNSKGFYAFRDLPEGIYMIGTLESGGYAPARLEVRTGVKYADLVLEPLRSAHITGTVTDTMGTELEGVRIMPLVKGTPAGTTSNADGKFELAVALQGDRQSFPVRFQLDGYREQRYHVTEKDSDENGHLAFTVELEPVYTFSTVSGSLTDSAGVQVAGETVRLYSPSLKRNYRAVSDAGGEYLFDKVEMADDYQLWVRPTGPYRDFTEKNMQLSQGSLRRDIELASLERGYRLVGRILDLKGDPVPGHTFTLRSKLASAQTLQLTSDEYGEFVVENAPQGELVFENRTMPYQTISGVHLEGDQREHHVTLVVDRGQHKLVGKVMDSSGKPVKAPRVYLTSSRVINGVRSRSSRTTSTDARGHFLFTDLGAGQYTVVVDSDGYEGVRLKPVVGIQDELVVRLEKTTI